jgi:class 3 adenylate cyclase/tetratricopeptide (TPR) repeat protein
MIRCPACGEENPERFRLCGYCGAPLAPPAPAAEIRKTVTIVFSDLRGSTDLGERLDAESLRELISRYFDAMRAELEAHGGTIEKYIGDAIMAVFGLPTVHEDDALRAVRAALSMRESLDRLNDQLERTWGVRLANRTGIHTGEVVAGDPTGGQRLVTGDPVNTAARLEQAAPVNGILLGELTYRLVRDVVDATELPALELKGKAELVRAWELAGLRTEPVQGRGGGSAMVGRTEELARLRERLADAVAVRRVRTLTILGDAGVGKSTLVEAFLSENAGSATMLRGRCLPYGRGITFWPLVEIMRSATGVTEGDHLEEARAKVNQVLGDEAVVRRISAITGLSTEAFPLAESFWAVGRMLDILGARAPLIVVIDDIHWAEPVLLELLAHLTDSGEAPSLLLCTARPDLLEDHPEWGTATGHDRIALGPLPDDEASRMVDALLGQSGIPAAIRDRITAAAEGNPLFLEQFVATLIEDGVIRRTEGGWRVADDIGDLQVPPSIHALLGARLDRLGREDRDVLEPASVVGLEFQRAAVRWLASPTLHDGLETRLGSLERRQLIHELATPAEDVVYRFHHILIRDAAYASLLKRRRAELHERFVAWADEQTAHGDHGIELEEILGWHLEQAHRYRAELSPFDEHGVALGVRASERLASAGRRADARGDMPATANLLARAARARPVGDPLRARLSTDAAEALIEVGELDEARALYDAAREEATAAGRSTLATIASLGSVNLSYLTEGGDATGVTTVVQGAIRELELAGDHAALARAWRILTNIQFSGCAYSDATTSAERMIAEARLANDRPMELRALPALATCAQLGPTPVPEAIAIIEGVLSELEGDRKAEAYTQRALANLEAMRGRFDEARALYRTSRATLDDLGWRFDAALTSAIASGPVELIAGDPLAAEQELRRDHDALAAMGERNYISTTKAFLAEALYRQQRDDEAMEMTRESEAIAAEDDVATQYLWRSVRAKLVARAGDHVDGERLAREAIDIIEDTQDPDSQGYAWVDLAEVLHMAGRADAAVEAARTSQARFRTKGNTASEGRARALVTRIEAGTSPGAA